MAMACRHAVFYILSVVPVAIGQSIADQCRNPLFEIHWFTGREGDVETLSAFPEVRTNLRLCPAHNGVNSCCREAFEHQQMLHFDYWKQILTYKIERLKKNRAAIAIVQRDPEFNTATNADLDHYQRALKLYEDVIDPASHAVCFSALVTYIAGMLCFACLPNWRGMVHEDYGKIVRILLTAGTCTEIWQRCESFGQQAKLLRQVTLDSRLATLQRSSLENFEMFHDQQALCDWMHDAVAMHPFTTPSEMEREAVPASTAIRTLAEDVPIEKQQYDAMKAGKSAGFDITWGGFTGSAPPSACNWLGLCTSLLMIKLLLEV